VVWITGKASTLHRHISHVSLYCYFFNYLYNSNKDTLHIFDDIGLNYLGRVAKAGDCNRISFVHINLHHYLANKDNRILKRVIHSCTKCCNLTTIFH